MKFISYVIEQTFLFALPNNDFRKTYALRKNKTKKNYILSISSSFVSCTRVYTYWPRENLKIKAVATTLVENMLLLNCMVSFHPPRLKKMSCYVVKKSNWGKYVCNTQLFKS